MAKYGDREIEAVIFDIDGTIIDSLAVYHECLNRELANAGFQPVPKDLFYYNLAAGVSLRDILGKILSDYKKDSEIEEIRDGVLKRFWQEDPKVTLLPGVKDTFDFLGSRGVRIGLASSRTTQAGYEWKKFSNFEIVQYIDVIVTCSEIEKRKPAPDVIVECARRMDITPEKCMVVGDSVSDVMAAKKAGSVPIGVTTGLDNLKSLQESGAEEVIERLDHLIELFEDRGRIVWGG